MVINQLTSILSYWLKWNWPILSHIDTWHYRHLHTSRRSSLLKTIRRESSWCAIEPMTVVALWLLLTAEVFVGYAAVGMPSFWAHSRWHIAQHRNEISSIIPGKSSGEFPEIDRYMLLVRPLVQKWLHEAVQRISGVKHGRRKLFCRIVLYWHFELTW